mmetsp:Transcript_13377/g.46565  ORF Transcript_13377/g.46565 Transcript_13377/m.46565 type:complete len:220 (-) Transcript_13377:487-1146(-)
MFRYAGYRRQVRVVVCSSTPPSSKRRLRRRSCDAQRRLASGAFGARLRALGGRGGLDSSAERGVVRCRCRRRDARRPGRDAVPRVRRRRSDDGGQVGVVRDVSRRAAHERVEVGVRLLRGLGRGRVAQPREVGEARHDTVEPPPRRGKVRFEEVRERREHGVARVEAFERRVVQHGPEHGHALRFEVRRAQVDGVDGAAHARLADDDDGRGDGPSDGCV